MNNVSTNSRIDTAPVSAPVPPIEDEVYTMERRKALGLIAATGAAAAFPALPAFGAEPARATVPTGGGRAAAKGGYTFALDKNVKRISVRFTNRYGIEVAGDLYVPKNVRAVTTRARSTPTPRGPRPRRCRSSPSH
jgi:hypothetical protein